MPIQSVRDIYDSGEWVDATSIGSSYEVQYNQRNGQSRYRARPGDPRSEMESTEEWRNGIPPGTKRG